MSKRILLVEDEKNFGRILKDYLSMNGYSVVLCEDGEHGLAAFKEGKFDLCILDVMMPKKDGFTLGKEIKEIDKNIPLFFLTAKGMKEDVLKGYKLGAEDYLTKPFDTEVLLLKLDLVFKRKILNVTNENEFLHQIGTFTFNSKLRSLKNPKGEVKLSPKEAALLNLLCQHKNDVLLREKALKEIWKEDTYFTGRSMDVYIVKLRKFLASDSKIEINNLHGNGYSLQVK